MNAAVQPPATADLPQLVVCDLFDTLVVAERRRPDHREAARLLGEGLAVDHDTARRLVYPLYLGMVVRERRQLETVALIQSTCDQLALSVGADEVCTALWSILGNGNGDLRLRPGVADFLAEIRAAGHELRLLSNCMLPVSWMHRLLAEVGLAGAFDACYFSSGGAGKKPELDFFRTAGEGDFARRWMLGDLVDIDLQPAAELGWETVLVGGEHDWAQTAATILASAKGADA